MFISHRICVETTAHYAFFLQMIETIIAELLDCLTDHSQWENQGGIIVLLLPSTSSQFGGAVSLSGVDTEGLVTITISNAATFLGSLSASEE